MLENWLQNWNSGQNFQLWKLEVQKSYIRQWQRHCTPALSHGGTMHQIQLRDSQIYFFKGSHVIWWQSNVYFMIFDQLRVASIVWIWSKESIRLQVYSNTISNSRSFSRSSKTKWSNHYTSVLISIRCFSSEAKLQIMYYSYTSVVRLAHFTLFDHFRNPHGFLSCWCNSCDSKHPVWIFLHRP